jgi:hypothetical protein
MSSTDRQTRLLLAEDWKKIYQSFKHAEFKSYDFDNLRRVMIDYIRNNYPEDFNDYIESSEYLALIDLIAFLGQNISFRIDLNARENFIELAERKESVLRLARLLSYNPQRNRAANGLLKIVSVSSTESVVDSNGSNLANKAIVWNDNTNVNWFEQFLKVMNSALPAQNKFGNPSAFEFVSGIPTEQYRFNAVSNNVPTYSFSKSVNGRGLRFEVVSTGISEGNIIEEPPNPFNQLGFVYRDNGQGPGSSTTGFFVHFREGTLQRADFSVDTPTPNQKVDIDVQNINQTDVWIYGLNSNNVEQDLWTKVDAVEGNNIVYNSLNKKIRNIYSVLTRVDDRVSLIFSDGIFGNLPFGKFRVYYRTSANRDYTIFPSALTNISIQIPYVSQLGRIETITLGLSLQTAVNNSSISESVESIKNNAPSTYYTQNRLVTAEDYNVGPLSVSQDIIKVKSVNRVSSGISRYFDILDATGKYSKTVLFGDDGIIYKEFQEKKNNFKFSSKTDIEQVIENQITPILQDNSVRNFYLSEFGTQNLSELGIAWSEYYNDTNLSSGVFKDRVIVEEEISTNTKNNETVFYQVSSFTSGPLRFVEPGAMIKFIPPAGKKFNKRNDIVADNSTSTLKSYIWTKVVNVSGAGIDISNNRGSISFNDRVPSGAILNQVLPKFSREISSSVKNQIIEQAFAFRTFGLRYDIQNREWRLINDDNLNVFGDFSLAQTGNINNQQLDSSWLLLFETDGSEYNITYRCLRYVFESDKNIRFYFDGSRKIYDSKTGSIVKDKIKLLSINNQSDSFMPYTRDFDWEISAEYKDVAGYVDSKKLEVTFFDSDDDGIIDDPEIFNQLVLSDMKIFTKKIVKDNSQYEVYVNQEQEKIWIYDPAKLFDNVKRITPSRSISQFDHNDVVYDSTKDVFYKIDRVKNVEVPALEYSVYNGRDDLKFQYVHATDDNRRLDPSSTNIIDSYLLTRQYDTAYRQYLQNRNVAKPLPPSSDSLFQSFGNEINKIKSISDEVIYHPVKYKPLFGSKSELNLQSIFKVVKNPQRVISDNEIKSRVISAINKYFELDNWDFGETFYFSELAAYIVKDLSPDLLSIVIVPRDPKSNFGSLFEIKAEADEIFISSATVDDVEIITSNTADRLRTQGAIVSSTQSLNVGVQSAQGLNISTTTGGFTY